jgi:adenylate kinase
MRIVLLGPPGSGKGTQAVGLADSLIVPHIATGDIFRAEIASQSTLGRLANDFIAHGNFVPDEIVNDVMRERLSRADADGFVLDGYPRTLEQAQSLQSTLEKLQRPLDIALALEVPDDRIVERAVGRLICPQCGAIYHLTSKPPQLMGVCDVDRGRLEVREDDQPSTVRHRLGVYHRLTEPVLEFYRSRNLLRSVDGLGERTEVGDRLRAALHAAC